MFVDPIYWVYILASDPGFANGEDRDPTRSKISERPASKQR